MLVYVTSAYSDPEPVQTFLALAAFGKRHHLTENPDEADVIFFVENSRYHEDPFFTRLRKHPLVRRHRERCFMYNEHDHPWCVLPGVYCSMPKRWFNARLQRAARYIRLLNPIDASPSDEPDILFSFMGNSQISLRRKMLCLRSSRAIFVDTSSFNPFLAANDGDHRTRYAGLLRRTKFVLCPRGSGTSSIRLFETLREGRVPVIVSDQWVAPEGPDWSSCSLRLNERDISGIEQLTEDAEPRWPELAANARKVWNEWFADEVLFDRLVDELAQIIEDRKVSEGIAQHLPDVNEWSWRARRAFHFVHSHCTQLSVAPHH